jgi:fermentation-respiration switch protein FrsA (DUF1100 family)
MARGAALAIAVAAIAYAGLLTWLRLDEDRLVFHAEAGKLRPAPAELGLDARDVRFVGLDSTPLVARVVPPPADVSADSAPWILYFHGAGGNVGTPGYDRAWARFRQRGFGVFAVDYRGFGESGGHPTEAGLYRDADSAYAYLTGTLHVAPGRIVIYGYSLGSGVAIDLASRVSAAGLIVEGAFTSISDRGAELYPFVPVRWLARNRFASIEKVARVSMPKLFIHARDDVIVPIAHAERLFAVARGPKEFQAVTGGHVHAFERDPEFLGAVDRFARELGLLAPTPAWHAPGTP